MSAAHFFATTFACQAPGKDSYALILGSLEWGSTVDRCTIKADGGDWALKMPGNRDSVITGSSIYGGRERALDAVRGGNLTFNSCTFGCGLDRTPTRSRFSLRKQCDIGLKGGLVGAEFNDCVMTDLLLGDFSIYDHEGGLRTTGVKLTSCRHPAGRDVPIIVRCLHATPPELVDTNAIVLRVPRLVVGAYFEFCRRFGDTRKPAA